MAEMHPVDIENYNYTPSEKYMYEAFRDRLDKKYHVFYSVRWFEVEEGKRIDSESDFIVFDSNFLLCSNVKYFGNLFSTFAE